MKEEKKLRHWLHIILTLLTGGFWLLVYVFLLAVNEMNNRVVRGYNQGWKDAQVSLSQRNMGKTWYGSPWNQNPQAPQAALSPEEGEEFRGLVNAVQSGEGLTFAEHQRFEHLRSRFQ